MTSKKQDQKHEQILRGLLALPENKKCADCTAKHPSYANVSLNTFICTTCAGLHREFSHRVKSVSVAKFTPEEIQALQQGGNEVARQYWLKNWNSSKYPEPENTDTDKLRDFLKTKYVQKQWIGKESTTTQKTTTTKKHTEETEEVRVEPLSKILGKDIPPISVNQNRKPDWDPFGDDGSGSHKPASSADEEFNPFGVSSTQSGSKASSQTQEFNPFQGGSAPPQNNELASIFGSQQAVNQQNGHSHQQQQTQQQFQPFQQQQQQPTTDQKAKDLQSQLGMLYQQSAQAQNQLMQQQWMLLNQQMFQGQQPPQQQQQQGFVQQGFPQQGYQQQPYGVGPQSGFQQQQGFGIQHQGFHQQQQGFVQQQHSVQGLGGLQGLQGFGPSQPTHSYGQQPQINPYLSEPVQQAPLEPEKPNPFGSLKDIKPQFTKKTTPSNPPSSATSPTVAHNTPSSNVFDDNPFGFSASSTPVVSSSTTTSTSGDLFSF